MLFLLFTYLSAVFCGKPSFWKAAGEGSAEPFSAVRQRLRSGQRAQPRLAPAEGHRCCSEHGIVQHPSAVWAPAVPRTPPPPTVPSPGRPRQGAPRMGRIPPAPARPRLPRHRAFISQLQSASLPALFAALSSD